MRIDVSSCEESLKRIPERGRVICAKPHRASCASTCAPMRRQCSSESVRSRRRHDRRCAPQASPPRPRRTQHRKTTVAGRRQAAAARRNAARGLGSSDSL